MSKIFGPKKSWSEKKWSIFWSKNMIWKQFGRHIFSIKNRPTFFSDQLFFDQKISTNFFIWWLSKKIDHFFSIPAISRPKSTKMSTQGNARNFFLEQMPDKSRLILCGTNRLPVLTNFRAIPLPTSQNPWKGYTYVRWAMV